MTTGKKLILSIEGDFDRYCRHIMIHLNDKRQFKYLYQFLKNFISNKKKLSETISSLRYSLKRSHDTKVDMDSSYKVKDKISTIDILEMYQQNKMTLFLVVNFNSKYSSKAGKYNRGHYFE